MHGSPHRWRVAAAVSTAAGLVLGATALVPASAGGKDEADPKAKLKYDCDTGLTVETENKGSQPADLVVTQDGQVIDRFSVAAEAKKEERTYPGVLGEDQSASFAVGFDGSVLEGPKELDRDCVNGHDEADPPPPPPPAATTEEDEPDEVTPPPPPEPEDDAADDEEEPAGPPVDPDDPVDEPPAGHEGGTGETGTGDEVAPDEGTATAEEADPTDPDPVAGDAPEIAEAGGPLQLPEAPGTALGVLAREASIASTELPVVYGTVSVPAADPGGVAESVMTPEPEPQVQPLTPSADPATPETVAPAVEAPTAPAPSAGGSDLAQTGAPTMLLLSSSLVLLLAGGWLVWLGQRSSKRATMTRSWRASGEPVPSA